MYTALWVNLRDFSKVVLIIYNYDFTCWEARINLPNTDPLQTGFPVLKKWIFLEAPFKLALYPCLRWSVLVKCKFGHQLSLPRSSWPEGTGVTLNGECLIWQDRVGAKVLSTNIVIISWPLINPGKVPCFPNHEI